LFLFLYLNLTKNSFRLFSVAKILIKW